MTAKTITVEGVGSWVVSRHLSSMLARHSAVGLLTPEGVPVATEDDIVDGGCYQLDPAQMPVAREITIILRNGSAAVYPKLTDSTLKYILQRENALGLTSSSSDELLCRIEQLEKGMQYGVVTHTGLNVKRTLRPSMLPEGCVPGATGACAAALERIIEKRFPSSCRVPFHNIVFHHGDCTTTVDAGWWLPTEKCLYFCLARQTLRLYGLVEVLTVRKALRNGTPPQHLPELESVAPFVACDMLGGPTLRKTLLELYESGNCGVLERSKNGYEPIYVPPKLTAHLTA